MFLDNNCIKVASCSHYDMAQTTATDNRAAIVLLRKLTLDIYMNVYIVGEQEASLWRSNYVITSACGNSRTA